MTTVSALWRHPIKSHGREALDAVTLVEGQTMPWDRHWAVTHQQTKFSAADPDWVMCRNFMIGNLVPPLAGIWATWDEAAGIMHLRHQSLDDIRFAPDDPADVTRFLDWVAPLTADVSLEPTALVSAGERGMTDTDYPTLSIMNTASHAAVAARAGGVLEAERWRGNIWLDGPAPWEEFEWIGRDLQIGEAVLSIREPIHRCGHTKANPTTGKRDIDTLDILSSTFGHENFGVYAVVTIGGRVAVGDTCEVL